MSVIKSQIHDGFATIRTRGLHRSRSRGEQWQHVKPTIVTKSDSMPLYENNNNDLSYNNYKQSTEFQYNNSTDTNTINNDDCLYESFSTVCSSFKQYKSHTPSSSSVESAQLRDYENCVIPPPPPAPSDYATSYENLSTNVKTTPQSPDSIKSNEYFLYTRPESPKYGQIGLIENTAQSEEFLNYSSKFKPSYYRNTPPPEIPKIPLEKVITRPPIKSSSLQYRKSYSHPSKIVYEDLMNNVDSERFTKKYYNSSTNYLETSKLSENSLKYNNSSGGSIQLCRNSSINNGTKSNYTDRRYATLSYPKEAQRNKQHRFQQQQQQNCDYDLEYLDPLDCKIGCQTTLRCKPRIPWYELAIRKENRRQSCPPIEVNVNIYFIFMFTVFFSVAL